LAYNCVLILSNGVTAKRDSVTPAPNPAITVRGPDILPFSSSSKDLNVSNATNPNLLSHNIRGLRPSTGVSLTYTRLKGIPNN
jgi:hypothetical protein